MPEEQRTVNWDFIEVELKDLRPYARNARQISKRMADRLSNSLRKYGICEPIVVSRDFVIIGGHQRYKMLKRQGKKKTVVAYPDQELTDDFISGLNIELNHTGGEYDYEMLANMWSVEELIEYGFEEKELGMDPELGSDTGEEEEKLQKYKITLEFMDKNCYDEAKKLCQHIADGHDGKIKCKE